MPHRRLWRRSNRILEVDLDYPGIACCPSTRRPEPARGRGPASMSAGIATPRGGDWSAVQVKRILDKAAETEAA